MSSAIDAATATATCKNAFFCPNGFTSSLIHRLVGGLGEKNCCVREPRSAFWRYWSTLAVSKADRPSAAEFRVSSRRCFAANTVGLNRKKHRFFFFPISSGEVGRPETFFFIVTFASVAEQHAVPICAFGTLNV